MRERAGECPHGPGGRSTAPRSPRGPGGRDPVRGTTPRPSPRPVEPRTGRWAPQDSRCRPALRSRETAARDRTSGPARGRAAAARAPGRSRDRRRPRSPPRARDRRPLSRGRARSTTWRRPRRRGVSATASRREPARRPSAAAESPSTRRARHRTPPRRARAGLPSLTIRARARWPRATRAPREFSSADSRATRRRPWRAQGAARPPPRGR